MDGLLILKALDASEIREVDVSKTYSFIEKRNRSILAHGLTKIDSSDCKSFMSFFSKMIKSILSYIFPNWVKYQNKLILEPDAVKLLSL